MFNPNLAAQRLGYGPLLGQHASPPLRSLDGWLSQLDPAALKRSAGDYPRADEAGAVIKDLRELREQRKAAADTDPVSKVKQELAPLLQRSLLSRYRQAAQSETPLLERLVHFWSNHFAVSIDKHVLSALVGSYENDAIRPHVLGNFRQLLEQAIRHPAMILFLDNQGSVGPNSKAANRARDRRGTELGLNENLAREVLELHTLGVAGGYQQSDVRSFANVLTGWSVGGGKGGGGQGHPGEFRYRDELHEPGPQTVLARRYEQTGIAQVQAVLTDLALAPATANFLASKLARHFVCDEPPPALVTALADTYLRHRGELLPVYRALLQHELTWALPWQKLKTPQDYVISSWRAVAYVPADAKVVVNSFGLLGEFPHKPGSPAGWPDIAADWRSAEGLSKRIEWAQLLVKRWRPAMPATEALALLYAPEPDDPLRQTVERAESAEQAWVLLLASPQFQRR